MRSAASSTSSCATASRVRRRTFVTAASRTAACTSSTSINCSAPGWDTGAAFVTLDYQDRSYLDASERGYANALSRRPTRLIPEQRLWSALFNGYQELSATLRLSATLYANDRDVDHIVFSSTTLSDSASWVETRQAGGTLALDWSVTPGWNVNLSHTYSDADTTRDNLLTSAVTGAEMARTDSLYEVGMSVTELIADGPLFPAPGGTVRLALGGEHRAEQLDATRHGNTQVALSRPLSLERDVDALFAEINVPLVGEQNARAGIHRLDVIAAVRHEEYSDFGSTTNPKFGIVYSPVAGLDLRGTYGTSFRAPHLNQFDDSFGVGVLFQTFDTGQIMAAATQLPSADLGPENATTWTAGFDLRPQSLPGLAINATYFQIEYEDRITETPLSLTPFSDPLALARVSIPPDPEVLAAYEFLAARDPGSVILFGVPPGTTLADAQATFDGRRFNAAVTNVSGIDLIVSQSFAVAGHDFMAGLNASYLFELENQVSSTSAPVDLVDTLYNPADLRLRSSLAWSHGPWSAAGYINYVDDYRDLQLPLQPRRVASWTTVDLSAAYTRNRLTVRFNVADVFDRAPPKVIERVAAYGNVGYDSENANPLGRYVSLMLSLAW